MAILAAAVSPLAAQIESREQLVRPVFDSAVLRFEPLVEVAAWTLTVSGPEGLYDRLAFEASSTPELPLVGPDGEALRDGHYTWELQAKVLGAGSGRRVQWGHFSVVGGAAVVPNPEVLERAAGPPAPAVPTEGPEGGPTHVDDVYIDGHLCVGSGFMTTYCDGGQSLAQRTILLREDNNRIHFEDTSVTAGFATTDWRITINSSAADDAAFFSIEELDSGTVPFTIEGGAADNALWVDENGRVGVGTSTPSVQLHVNGDAFVGGDFSAASSRELKHAFEEVEPEAVLVRLLELPVSEWSYRDDGSGARHLGPMAEDFHRLFSLGQSDRRVSPLDLSGVAFAAIQGLTRRLEEQEAETRAHLGEKDAQIAELRSSRDELAARLAALEQLVRANAAE